MLQKKELECIKEGTHYLKFQTNNHSFFWSINARHHQIMPYFYDPFDIWLILSGRGFGKTKMGIETIIHWLSMKYIKRIAFIGNTYHDIYHVMLFGPSGFFQNKWALDHFELIKSEHVIYHKYDPDIKIHLISSDNPQKLRGFQFDTIWIDEWAKFKNMVDIFEQSQFTRRLGSHNHTIITTTPIAHPYLIRIKELKTTISTQGSTFDNAKNLSTDFIKTMQTTYENTPYGKQELYGEITALQAQHFSSDYFIYGNYTKHITKTIIAIDPAVTSNEKSDRTGIIVASNISDNRFYVQYDGTCKKEPSEWMDDAICLYHEFNADLMIIESNNGGEIISNFLKEKNPHIISELVFAKNSKWDRFQFLCLLYKHQKIMHADIFQNLENELLSYNQNYNKSPDTMDALYWAIFHLKQKTYKEHSIWMT